LEISVPYLGEVEEVTLVRWLKGPGQWVEAGEAVAEVEADKAVFVIEAPAAGRIAQVLVPQGGKTRPGAAIGRLEPP